MKAVSEAFPVHLYQIAFIRPSLKIDKKPTVPSRP
jgi:hypothetical protein